MVSTGHTRNAWILGADLGTSSLKALVVDARGAIVASAMRAYPLHRPRLTTRLRTASLPTPRCPRLAPLTPARGMTYTRAACLSVALNRKQPFGQEG
ncbi:MAG: hypothetical protein ACXWQR_18925 [Ktedonobacterales bacterium]